MLEESDFSNARNRTRIHGTNWTGLTGFCGLGCIRAHSPVKTIKLILLILSEPLLDRLGYTSQIFQQDFHVIESRPIIHHAAAQGKTPM